jgi:hypothetical protein
MTTILTEAEAQQTLRLTVGVSDPILNIVLPAVDEYLKTATGHDWTADATINPLAKAAAIMLTVQWYENPAMIGSIDDMRYGITNVIAQLRASQLPAES